MPTIVALSVPCRSCGLMVLKLSPMILKIIAAWSYLGWLRSSGLPLKRHAFAWWFSSFFLELRRFYRRSLGEVSQALVAFSPTQYWRGYSLDVLSAT
jgi:hypothetical protein